MVDEMAAKEQMVFEHALDNEAILLEGPLHGRIGGEISRGHLAEPEFVEERDYCKANGIDYHWIKVKAGTAPTPAQPFRRPSVSRSPRCRKSARATSRSRSPG